MQTKRSSMTEALINTGIGYVINYLANLIILPLFFGVHLSLATNAYLGLIYTVIAVVRSYGVRRMFNWYHHGRYNGK